MNKIFAKKVIYLLGIIVLLSLFLLVSQANAGMIEVGLEYGTETGLGAGDFRLTMANIIKVSLGLLGIVAVALFIYGGFLYLIGRNDSEKLEKAKKILISAGTGLVVILVAFGITNYILKKIMEATGVEMAENGRIVNENINQQYYGDGEQENGEEEDDDDSIGLLTDTGFSMDYNGQSVDLGIFSLNKSIKDFYSYGTEFTASTNIISLEEYGGFFNRMIAANRTISFIYKDQSNPNQPKYYLINIHSEINKGSGGFNGSLTKTRDYFKFAILDDGILASLPNYPCDKTNIRGDRYGECNNKLVYNNGWAPCCTDGEVIYIGDGSEELIFDLTVNKFEPHEWGFKSPLLDAEWYFFSADLKEGILLAKEFPATVTINFKPNQ